MLLDMQVVFYFVCPIIENFEEVFMRRLAIGCVIIYHITIIPNTLDKVVNCMEFKVVAGWST